jgi:hypothetical protein
MEEISYIYFNCKLYTFYFSVQNIWKLYYFEDKETTVLFQVLMAVSVLIVFF